MLNYFVVNSLTGLDKKHELCSCGYEKIDTHEQSRLNVLYNSSACPECNAYNIHISDNLFFGEKKLNKVILESEIDKNNSYVFKIKVGIVNTTLSVDFNNQKMKLDSSKDCVKVFNTIIFNGKNPKDDMLKYYDNKKDEYITKEKFINNITLNKAIEHTYDICNRIQVGTLTNNIGATIPSMYNIHAFRNNMLDALNRLETLRDYCVEQEILIKSDINPYTLTGNTNTEESNTSSQLNLTPFMVKYLKEKGEQNHRTLQYIQDNLKEQAINYLNTFGELPNGLSLYNVRKITTLVNDANLSIKKLYKYLYHDAPMQQGLYRPEETLNLLYDSFDLATKLELPFDKNPKALTRYHDTLSKEYNTATDERKNELFAKVVETYKDMELIEEEPKPKEGEEVKKTNKQLYAMKLPKDAQELILEGKLMRHCVASYVDRVIREDSLIFFLRKVDEIDKPYVTIEVDPDTYMIRQVKCKANAKLKDVKAEKFINKWCKKNNIKWNGCW